MDSKVRSRLWYEKRRLGPGVMLSNAKKRAKKEGVPFALLPEDIIIPETCPVFGIPLFAAFDTGKTGPRDNSPSLDRIVPSLGYVRGNICIVSHRANRLKSDMTLREVLRLADYIRKNLYG